jgi:drug/metabolite transporter (DMT)-like permease
LTNPPTHEKPRQPAAARPRAAWPALLALVLVPLIWGYNWVVMKSALTYVGPFEFAAMRFVPASLVLLAAMAILRRPLAVKSLGAVALAGILQTAVNTALTLLALRTGPAGRSALLCYTMPFWAVGIAWVGLGERPGRIQLAALLAAGAGLGLVFVGGSGAGGNLAAAALATGSGVAWAWGAVITRRLMVRARMDTLAMTAWQMLFGGLALWVGAFIFPGRPTSWSPYLVFAVLYEVLPATAVAWLLWTALLQRVSAGVASLAILAAPVLGLAASAVQLGERPRGLEAAGLCLLVAALVLVGPLAVRQARRQHAVPVNGPAPARGR